MYRGVVLLVLVGALALTGCAWQTNLLNKKEALALETTLSRARFEMDCREAIGNVLSRTVTEPFYYGGLGSYSGLYEYPRAVYTIGIEGCGKRGTYVATCPDGSIGCFAALAGPHESKYAFTGLTR